MEQYLELIQTYLFKKSDNLLVNMTYSLFFKFKSIKASTNYETETIFFNKTVINYRLILFIYLFFIEFFLISLTGVLKLIACLKAIKS